MLVFHSVDPRRETEKPAIVDEKHVPHGTTIRLGASAVLKIIKETHELYVPEWDRYVCSINFGMNVDDGAIIFRCLGALKMTMASDDHLQSAPFLPHFSLLRRLAILHRSRIYRPKIIRLLRLRPFVYLTLSLIVYSSGLDGFGMKTRCICFNVVLDGEIGHGYTAASFNNASFTSSFTSPYRHPDVR